MSWTDDRSPRDEARIEDREDRQEGPEGRLAFDESDRAAALYEDEFFGRNL